MTPATAKDDGIVEAPRAPKNPLVERLRHLARGRTRTVGIRVVASVLGLTGFLGSVTLAVGAFTAALGPADDSAFFRRISSVCDALIGPLRDVFTFSGTGRAAEEALVAWGIGALAYLAIGLLAQSFLRSRIEE